MGNNVAELVQFVIVAGCDDFSLSHGIGQIPDQHPVYERHQGAAVGQPGNKIVKRIQSRSVHYQGTNT